MMCAPTFVRPYIRAPLLKQAIAFFRNFDCKGGLLFFLCLVIIILLNTKNLCNFKNYNYTSILKNRISKNGQMQKKTTAFSPHN